MRVDPQPPYSGVGTALPSIDAFGYGSPVVAVARAAEAVGLDHVWVPDHLVFHRPVLESMTALAAVAGATERIRLGFAILNPALRSVTWLAKQLATLGTLAPGRLLLGVGAGGEYEPEFRAAGVDRKLRGKLVDEALALLPRLLSGKPVRHEGLQTVDVDGISPALETMPPVLVGGRSNVALRRAARFGDAWLPMWMDPEEVAAARVRLGLLATELERPAPGIALVSFVNVTDDPAGGRAQAAEFIQRQYGMPFDKVERWTLIGGPEEVAERLRAYRVAGVEGFCLAPAHPRSLEQVGALAVVREALIAHQPAA